MYSTAKICWTPKLHNSTQWEVAAVQEAGRTMEHCNYVLHLREPTSGVAWPAPRHPTSPIDLGQAMLFTSEPSICIPPRVLVHCPHPSTSHLFTPIRPAPQDNPENNKNCVRRSDDYHARHSIAVRVVRIRPLRCDRVAFGKRTYLSRSKTLTRSDEPLHISSMSRLSMMKNLPNPA